MLSKQGHRVTHVVSGLAAIDAITLKQFDLVFMDIQMPDMDGLEATVRIRQLEERTAQHTKIVAMTAHAMEGDRERCLAAGMDDYISKPIRADELQRVLRTIEAALPAPLSEAPSARVHTQAELRDICNGDDELVSELIALFRSDTPQLMNVIQQAATNHDSAGLAAGAHKLLSSLGTFGATDACEMVRTLEGQGRSALFDGAEERVRNLEREIDLIHACLAQYVPGSLPGPASMPAAEGLGLTEDYHVGA
jgi:CheY-like chemotaxis protein